MSVKPITPADARKNAAIAKAMVQNEPPAVAGQVGMHALAFLADMLPHAEFATFINSALHHATTGQLPPDPDDQQQDQPQPQPQQPQPQQPEGTPPQAAPATTPGGTP